MVLLMPSGTDLGMALFVGDLDMLVGEVLDMLAEEVLDMLVGGVPLFLCVKFWKFQSIAWCPLVVSEKNFTLIMLEHQT